MTNSELSEVVAERGSVPVTTLEPFHLNVKKVNKRPNAFAKS